MSAHVDDYLDAQSSDLRVDLLVGGIVLPSEFQLSFNEHRCAKDEGIVLGFAQSVTRAILHGPQDTSRWIQILQRGF